jgi:hypothetical protein
MLVKIGEIIQLNLYTLEMRKLSPRREKGL